MNISTSSVNEACSWIRFRAAFVAAAEASFVVELAALCKGVGGGKCDAEGGNAVDSPREPISEGMKSKSKSVGIAVSGLLEEALRAALAAGLEVVVVVLVMVFEPDTSGEWVLSSM